MFSLLALTLLALPLPTMTLPTSPDLDAIATTALATHTTHGFAYTVLRNGETLFSRGYGLADLASNTPVNPHTRFAIGSLTKQFTAVAILQLAEQGRLALTDPLAKYLPELPNAQTITLRMLLNQTSGLHNYPNTREHAWPTTGTIPPATLLAILATDKPDFPPGDHFAYSNTNYFALALIIERITHQLYAAHLAQTIFQPLAMTGTASGFTAQQNIATPYASAKPVHPMSLDLYLGAGSLVSTAEDLARWDAALLNGTLLNPASMQLLWSPGLDAAGAATPYAMGFVPATLAGRRQLWHNGLTPGAGGYTFNALFPSENPDDNLAIIVLSNDAAFRPQPETIVAATLKAIFPAAPQTTPLPKEDPAVTTLARKIYSQMRTGKVDETLLTPEMARAFSPGQLAQTAPIFNQLGDPTRLTLERSEAKQDNTKTPPTPYTVYTYLATFAAAELHVQIVIDAQGKVAGYTVRP